MKKRFIVLIAAAMLMMGGSVYAGTLTSGSVTGASGVEILGQKGTGTTQSLGKLSNKVYLGATYNVDTYAFTTKHDAGTKKYGSSAGDTKLYYLDEDKSVTLSAPSQSDSSAFTSWTAL